jgi:glycosyltransferase involved in cell wall biosynthesis
MTPDAEPVSLSACLIVKNEEQRLPACLASVAFCDELVVVDSGSSDRTVEVAAAAGASVLQRSWRGFAAQRNIALDEARGEWVLEVDADERITPRLRDEIYALIDDPPAEVDNAMIPVRQLFLGKALGPSAMYPACRMRLFRPERYQHDVRRTVHEGLWPAGRSAYLDGDLEHILAESWREAFRDLTVYSRLESMQLHDTSTRALLVGIVVRPLVKFVYRSVLLGGWRDGWAGMTKIAIDCLYDSLTWIRHLRSGARRGRTVESRERDSGAGRGGHFGSVIGYSGPVRIAAIARGPGRTAVAHNWLSNAERAGADAVLITDSDPPSGSVRTARIEGPGLVSVLRAVTVESQHNPIEALVLGSARERRAARLLPSQSRGTIEPVSLDADPADLINAVLGQRAR